MLPSPWGAYDRIIVRAHNENLFWEDPASDLYLDIFRSSVFDDQRLLVDLQTLCCQDSFDVKSRILQGVVANEVPLSNLAR